MYFFLPFRSKNPTALFPWVTLSLIVINILVYALTTDYFLTVREGVVADFGLTYHHFSILRLFTCMFLHASPLHLIGNMLFLWIFGPAVEGRLGYLRFIAYYLFVGAAAGICHTLVDGVLRPDMPEIGASGPIMGIAGGYLYLFPFAQILIAYFYTTFVGFRAGVANWQAQWVILLFLAFDVFNGLLFHGMDGTAHFAHIGGAAAGFGILLLMRLRRDSEDVSEAQAMRADVGGHLLALPLHDLESLMQGHPDDPKIAMAFLRKAATSYNAAQRKMGVEALKLHGPALIEAGHPDELAVAVLGCPEVMNEATSPFLFRLGAKLEANGSLELAARCYEAVCRRGQPVSDEEMAFARLARLTEQHFEDRGRAAAIWTELVRRFPNGPQAMNADNALRRLGKPTLVFSTGKDAERVSDVPARIPDGFATVTAAGPPSPHAAAPLPESSYAVGDVRGMSLRPIGNPTPVAAPPVAEPDAAAESRP